MHRRALFELWRQWRVSLRNFKLESSESNRLKVRKLDLPGIFVTILWVILQMFSQLWTRLLWQRIYRIGRLSHGDYHIVYTKVIESTGDFTQALIFQNSNVVSGTGCIWWTSEMNSLERPSFSPFAGNFPEESHRKCSGNLLAMPWVASKHLDRRKRWEHFRAAEKYIFKIIRWSISLINCAHSGRRSP